MKELGATLRHFRKQTGITQRQLAEALNVDPTTISQYENGRRSFPIDLLEPACECMGISTREFLDEVFPDTGEAPR